MGARLIFNSGQWHPSKEQFVIALSMIHAEERKRICDFVFKRDVKSSLVGRLLIRKAIRQTLHLNNKDIILKRTEHGRPYLEENKTKSKFDFNISHQTDLVVLASDMNGLVGVDTMLIDRPVGSGSVDDFFKIMHRQFNNNEWLFINSTKNDKDRLINFYRLWCIKESYVKAVGQGIGFSLSRIECCIDDNNSSTSLKTSTSSRSFNDMLASPEQVEIKKYSTIFGNSFDGPTLTSIRPLSSSSYVKVDGVKIDGCFFEENIVMENYFVCVAILQLDPKIENERSPVLFRFLTIDDLLELNERNINNEFVIKNSLEGETFDNIRNKFNNDWTNYQLKNEEPLSK